ERGSMPADRATPLPTALDNGRAALTAGGPAGWVPPSGRGGPGGAPGGAAIDWAGGREPRGGGRLTDRRELRGEVHRYSDYAQLTAFLQESAELYRGLAELVSIGKSYEGREIWLLALTNRETGHHRDKPAYYMDGNIHAGEVAGSATCCYTIWHLLTRYGRDDLVTRLLDTRAFYILPRITVDGTELFLKTPETLRSSVRRYPFEDEPDGLH